MSPPPPSFCIQGHGNTLPIIAALGPWKKKKKDGARTFKSTEQLLTAQPEVLHQPPPFRGCSPAAPFREEV